MRYSDIQKLHDAGLITAEQRSRIVEHFSIKEEGSRFLGIISIIGAVLVGAGIILLISANWASISHGIKIACGLALMLGAHAAGWWLRDVKKTHTKTGEALHLVGSALFLANIALIGQIYNLSSRPSNAVLLWLAGIVALPWILRSKAHHIMVLFAFFTWFAIDINQTDSLIYCGEDQYQMLLYGVLGMIYLGFGYCLRGTRFGEFAKSTEKLGLLAFQIFGYALTLDIWGTSKGATPGVDHWLFTIMALAALLLVILGLAKRSDLPAQMRWVWGLALTAGLALFAGRLYMAPQMNWGTDWHSSPFSWIALFVFFVLSLIQIQVGLKERSSYLVNLGVGFVALHIITTYIQLIGSMARTCTLFVISGVLLIALGVFLEKQRRALMRQIKTVTN